MVPFACRVPFNIFWVCGTRSPDCACHTQLANNLSHWIKSKSYKTLERRGGLSLLSLPSGTGVVMLDPWHGSDFPACWCLMLVLAVPRVSQHVLGYHKVQGT